MITWERSNLDIPDILSPISHYTVWRYDEILTFITQVPAMQLDQYSVIATTLYDSCELGCNYSKFQVVAHTADISVYFTSEVDSGYSVNNTGAPFAIDDSPEEIAVWQIYPNPAEDVVSVSLGSGQYAVGSWQLAVGQKINLMICDLCGRELWRFLDEVKSRGEYSKSINVSDMPAGVYLVRVQAGEHSAVRKIVVR
jgi:hypothetical protein